jgi:hypothetical protein
MEKGLGKIMKMPKWHIKCANVYWIKKILNNFAVNFHGTGSCRNAKMFGGRKIGILARNCQGTNIWLCIFRGLNIPDFCLI